MIGAIVGAFYYLNQGGGVGFNPNSTYCWEFERRVTSDDDFKVSYGDRLRSFIYGCDTR